MLARAAALWSASSLVDRSAPSVELRLLGPDTDAPHLLTHSPIDGENDVAVNALVGLGFNEPLNVTTIAPNIQVSTGGQPIPVLCHLDDH